MPKIKRSAYSDSEYKIAIKEVMKDYENVDDFDVTIKHLKGEWWKLFVAKFIMLI